MTTYTSKQYNNTPPTSSEAGDALVFQSSYTFTAATTLAIGDIVKLCKLPAGCVLTHMRLDTDALGTTCAGSVGFLNAGATDMSQAVIAIGSLATAAIKNEDTTAGLRVAAADTDTPIGIKITTANTVDAAQGVKISLTIIYRPKQNIEV